MIAAVFSFTFLPIFSQERAVTESGKTVLIFPDGTWKNEKSKPSPSGSNEFSKPASSTARANILRNRASIYYNPKKWKPKSEEEGGRTTFIHTDGDAQAIIITERIQMPMDGLEKMALENAKAAAPDAVVTHRETRRVNGLDIVLLQIKGTIQGTKFHYYSYYYSSEKGIIQAITFTAQNLFNEYQPDFEEFLNGLTVDSSK